MPKFSELVRIIQPWGDWLFLEQQRNVEGGGGFHIHNPWGNSNQPQGSPDRNRLEIGYRNAAGADQWGQVVVHGPTGNVGLGVVNPGARLEVNGPWRDWLFLRQQRDVEGGGGFHIHNPWGNSNQPQGSPDRNRLEIGYRNAAGADQWGQVVVHGPTGNVGLGVVNPRARLHVNGDVVVTGDIALQNADLAERFHVAEPETVAPGTVMVLDDEEEDTLRSSDSSYDPRVIGVISGAGSFRPAVVLNDHGEGDSDAAVALVGKVYCKVDADPSPIRVGDLLTTSDSPGHAMKAVDPERSFGATLGKALRRLPSGQGLLPILVALQ